MSLHYLLDGYNILYQIPEFHDKPLEDQRQTLIDRIEQFRPQGSNRVTIFFDGKPGRTRPRETTRVKAVFTQDKTADERIKYKVSHSLNGKLFVVVTNDREIQYAVRSEGAKILSVEVFWTKCQAASRSRPRPGRKVSDAEGQAITDELKDVWLKKNETE